MGPRRRELRDGHPFQPPSRDPTGRVPTLPPRSRSEGNIVEHAQVREQQVVLENHSDGPFVRRAMDSFIGHRDTGDRDPPIGYGEQTSECPDRRRFACAVGTQQGNDLTGGRVQLDVEGEGASPNEEIGDETTSTGYHLLNHRSRSRTSTKIEAPSSRTESSNAAPGSVSRAR